jgi:ADP-dependent NAD(P)H-hydrate dehydratase / NAD(P)H-hydrate epimerase
MTELLTAAQMRAIEEAAIASGEVTGLELMERAGRGVVEAIFEEWPELKATSHRAVVLCGPGNNGGDGFVVARLLQEWGWSVQTHQYGRSKPLSPETDRALKRLIEVYVEKFKSVSIPGLNLFVSSWGKSGQSGDNVPASAQERYDIVVDALFGTGLTRGLEKRTAMIAHASAYEGSRVGTKWVSVDLPSGICGDSGRALSTAITADLTVTFHRQKAGHQLADGPAYSGKVKVKDIGLS